MDIASTSAETPSPVAEDIRNKDVEAVVEKWIEVIRSGRERGKKKVNDSSTAQSGKPVKRKSIRDIRCISKSLGAWKAIKVDDRDGLRMPPDSVVSG
ncbi:hypothetical protein JHK84_050486 [Glycine max]|nr:hypothetical protein JHK84_050486 [Glycine max]